jgi:hypothetical protein
METKELETLQKTSVAMYLALDSLYQLHAEVELEGNDETVKACAHCSAIANGVVNYPCPSVHVLLTDFFTEDGEESEASN